jgi:uncharacterized protein (DUF433 family)
MRDRSETTEAKAPRSYRLPPTLIEDLERHARAVGLKVTSLVERYLSEGLRRDEHPLIVFRDGAAGRRAALVGTRLDVWQVLETTRAEGSPREAADYLGIPEAHVRACVRYYAFFKDEIDEWTERMHDAAEAEREAWEREQAVLA